MTDRPPNDANVDPQLDLVLERIVDVPPALLWRAWTEPEHLMCWFTPKPWETIACEIDLRRGGLFRTTMRSPEGEVQPPNDGCYLEVVPERKLVFTDALGAGYRPLAKPFMTATVLFDAEGEGTRYVAIAQHVDEDGREAHKKMGFLEGWGTALDQLVVHARTLGAQGA